MQWAFGDGISLSRQTRDLLGGQLQHVRWATICTMLMLALIHPLVKREGWPAWLLVLTFALYSLAVSLARQRLAVFRLPGPAAMLDLAVVSLLYVLSANPTGIVPVLFVLVIVCAAATNPVPYGLFYTVLGMLVMAVISLNLPLWTPTSTSLRHLLVRLIFTAFAGGITALIADRLEKERRAGQASRADAERLAELNRLRGAFVSAVSHDLRTPLTSIRAGLGLLEASLEDRLRPAEGQLLGATRRNCDRLGLLVDDLLAYHQIEAGAMSLVRTSLDLRDLAAAAVAVVRPMLDEKGQRVELDLPERLPYTGDARRLEHALVNLLANAYHHTPSGTTVRVSGHTAAGEVALCVSDDGPGIPAAELDSIFQRFHRLAPTTAGSGLGLAIAKRVVELHGGRIWAERETGRGASFHILLPSGKVEGI